VTRARESFEPWAHAAFALAGATAALFLYLGSRTGGSGPVLVYRFGLLVSGWASAVGLLFALYWSVRRRPVLQRRRVWPLAALGASLWLCSLPFPYPSSHEGRFSATRFRLPFEGAARVRYGGEHARANPLLFDPSRRFGHGFEPLDAVPIWVVAPADGEVVARASGRGGELLVVATAGPEFCVLEGLGETLVAPRERVARGQRLGRSHGLLYVHLQDAPEPGRGEGIPMRYFGYRADGREAAAGVPVPPQEVAGVEPDAGR
jgi:hypothetical protein